jgi:hypothetical protein
LRVSQQAHPTAARNQALVKENLDSCSEYRARLKAGMRMCWLGTVKIQDVFSRAYKDVLVACPHATHPQRGRTLAPTNREFGTAILHMLSASFLQCRHDLAFHQLHRPQRHRER